MGSGPRFCSFMTVFRPLYLPLLLCGLGTSLSAAAQQLASPEGWCTDTLLNTAVVTGTRTPRTVADSPVQTRVITAEDIRRADANNVHDVLTHELPGLEFTQALSGNVNFNLSGFSGQGVLFLVNGERLAGETMDNVDFERINLADVERIEIIRGAASALYGSNAAGGVINIITRQQISRPYELRWEMRNGRHDDSRQNLFFATGRHRFTQLFALSRTAVDEYRLHNPADVSRYTKYSLNRVPAGHSFQARERLVFCPDDRWTLTGNVGYYFRQRDFDPGERNRYRDFTGGAKAEWNGDEGARGELAYRFDQYDKSDYYPTTGLDVRDYSNVQHTLRALFSAAPLTLWNDSRQLELTVGADFGRDYLLSYQFRGRSHRQITADAYFQADARLGAHWEAVATARYDYFSAGHHGRPTTKLTARYRNGAFTLRAAYGQGFRAPTLKEKYMNFFLNDIFIIRGHEHLRPEVSHNWQLSADWTHGGTELSGSVSYNAVHDRITTAEPTPERDAVSGLPFVDYVNVPRLAVWSAQLGVNHRRRMAGGTLSGMLQYAFTHEQTPTGSTLTPYMPSRPHSATARLAYDRRYSPDYAVGMQLSGRFLSSLSGTEYNTVTGASRTLRYPAYVILRLTLTQQIGSAVRLQLTADNLLNYRPHIYYYNAPLTDGLNLSVGMTLHLDRLF